MVQYPIPENLDPFVKEIIFFENDDKGSENNFPFYADGFPGIIFSSSINPFYLLPKNKKLSDFYLYGQTIEPISLNVKGSFRLIIFKLYPFAVRILLGIDAKKLNDDCYDLMNIKYVNTGKVLKSLREIPDLKKQVSILTSYFYELLKIASDNIDKRIILATNLILKSNGNISIKEIRSRLLISERTFERHFLRGIGVTPKQFAKIIQFNASIKQMTESDYIHLTDIGYNNGFSDQSHFIKSFKRYTGKTPKEFKREINSLNLKNPD